MEARRIGVAVMVALLAATATLQAQRTPTPALLVLAKSDHTLAIVDPASLKVVGRVPAGPDPHEVIASPDGRRAYISRQLGSATSRAGARCRQSKPAHKRPAGATQRKVASHSNYGFGADHTIAVVDLAAQKALPRIDLGVLYGPHGLAFAGGELYFTAEVNEVIGRYNPLSSRVDWVLGAGQMRTHMIEVAKDLDRIFTANVNSGTISIIEKPAASAGRGRGGSSAEVFWQQTVLKTGVGTEGFDVSPDGRMLWSAAARDGSISIIDVGEKRIVQTLPAGLRGANRVRFTPDGKYVFISSLSDAGGGDLAIFDTQTRRQIRRLSLGHGAAGILMQPDGSRAYVACSSDNYVAVIDLKTLKVIGHIDPGKGPDGMAWAVRR